MDAPVDNEAILELVDDIGRIHLNENAQEPNLVNDQLEPVQLQDEADEQLGEAGEEHVDGDVVALGPEDIERSTMNSVPIF
jgi:hypothetical protein